MCLLDQKSSNTQTSNHHHLAFSWLFCNIKLASIIWLLQIFRINLTHSLQLDNCHNLIERKNGQRRLFEILRNSSSRQLLEDLSNWQLPMVILIFWEFLKDLRMETSSRTGEERDRLSSTFFGKMLKGIFVPKKDELGWSRSISSRCNVAVTKMQVLNDCSSECNQLIAFLACTWLRSF